MIPRRSLTWVDGDVASRIHGMKLNQQMGVEPKIGGKPPKWMVYFMENPIKMDDLGGPPLFLETPISDSILAWYTDFITFWNAFKS